jgi:hypothetical protein
MKWRCRLSLGGRCNDLIRLAFAESLVLSVSGGVAGATNRQLRLARWPDWREPRWFLPAEPRKQAH